MPKRSKTSTLLLGPLWNRKMPKPLSRSLLLVCLLTAGPLWAKKIYKCTLNGKTVFQDVVCTPQAASGSVRVFTGILGNHQPEPDSPSSETRVGGSESQGKQPTTPRPTLSPEQRILANAERSRRLEQRESLIGDLNQRIHYTENLIDSRTSRLSSEIATLQAKKSYARNNLAGATWEQSISSEMQALTQKYKTMNDVDFEKLKQLRIALETAKTQK